MSELKPCPFCGKEVFLLDVSIQPAPYARWDVCCSTHDCFLRGGANNLYITREEAILAWNTRSEASEITALREQVKVLREALEEAKSFIKNGIDLGYITPPDPGDVAYDTLPTICAALEQAKPKDGK